MTWTLDIERVSNGWILRSPPELEEYAERIEVIADDADEVEAALSMLWAVMDHFGISSVSRHPRVVTIGIGPGTKHHDYHPQSCADCECKCDPDQSLQADFDNEWQETDGVVGDDDRGHTPGLAPSQGESLTPSEHLPVAYVPPFEDVR